MKRFEGKTVVITGAAAGIGRRILERFLAEGANCVGADIVAINPEDFSAIAPDAAVRLRTVKTNVSDREQVEAMIDLAVQEFGGVDVVCNNAGVSDRMEPIAELEDATWRRLMAINLDSVMYGTRHAVKYFLRTGTHGKIVNTASLSGLQGARGGAAYTASKFAVVGLTKNTAYMYAPDGIRCNCVCPAATRTNITQDLAKGGVSKLGMARATTGLSGATRQASPDEIASAVLFLASDEASYVNGVALVLDDAWSCY